MQQLLGILDVSTKYEFALMLAFMQEQGAPKGVKFFNYWRTGEKVLIETQILRKNKRVAKVILNKILPQYENVSLPDLIDMVTVQTNKSLQFLENKEALLVLKFFTNVQSIFVQCFSV